MLQFVINVRMDIMIINQNLLIALNALGLAKIVQIQLHAHLVLRVIQSEHYHCANALMDIILMEKKINVLTIVQIIVIPVQEQVSVYLVFLV